MWLLCGGFVMEYTKEYIQDKLTNDIRWMERALVVLYRRQTTDEQMSGETINANNRGFNSVDSRYLSWCAKWVLQGMHLSGHHIEKVGSKLKKYWKQIQDEIKQNE